MINKEILSAACNMCELAAKDKFASGYDLKCLACCARLVKSDRPLSMTHQESMLEVIASTRGAPTCKAVLDFLESDNGA